MAQMRRVKALPKPIIWAIARFIGMLTLTLRTSIKDPHGVLATEATPVIYALWHNRMICLPAAVPRYVAKRTVFLASRSRDGGYITDILAQFGMDAVRGSSSKGGAKSLIELRHCLESGKSLAVTPDGPRGPKYVPKDGIIWLASKTGVPIVPISINTRSHRELRGWDQTQVPIPFSKSQLIVGSPLTVPDELSDPELEAVRERVTAAMMAITEWDHADR